MSLHYCTFENSSFGIKVHVFRTDFYFDRVSANYLDFGLDQLRFEMADDYNRRKRLASFGSSIYPHLEHCPRESFDHHTFIEVDFIVFFFYDSFFSSVILHRYNMVLWLYMFFGWLIPNMFSIDATQLYINITMAFLSRLSCTQLNCI